jgi:hypothetical protein
MTVNPVTITQRMLTRVRYELFFRVLRTRVRYRIYARHHGETMTVWREKESRAFGILQETPQLRWDR